jgi:hypothetical protein
MEFINKFRSSAIKILNEKEGDDACQLNAARTKVSELLEDALLVTNYFNDKEHTLNEVARKIDEQLQLDQTSNEKTNTKLEEADAALDILNQKWPHSLSDEEIQEARIQINSWKA